MFSKIVEMVFALLGKFWEVLSTSGVLVSTGNDFWSIALLSFLHVTFRGRLTSGSNVLRGMRMKESDANRDYKEPPNWPPMIGAQSALFSRLLLNGST